MTPRFCSQCGHALEERRLPGDGRDRYVCPSCHFIAYQNAKPCAGVLPTAGGRVLLARRAAEPYRGHWDIVGGFMEHDETPEAAALREALEETGLSLDLVHLLGVYLDTYGTGGDSTLNVYYVARVREGQPHPADDVAELAWFAPEELPANMAFPAHTRRVLAAWAEWARERPSDQ